MRSTNEPTDRALPLGPAVKPTTPQAPEWKPHTQGIESDSAGNLRTVGQEPVVMPAPVGIIF